MYNNVKTAIAEYLTQVENEEFAARNHLFGNGAVESFENKLKDFYGIKYALCVDSATNGLLYLALAVGLRNSGIITTPLSYGATISGALFLNNKFHFADIDNTLNISPEAVRKILKENPKVKAVYAVDFGGIPHDIFSIKEVCDEFGVWYFADAAQSLGAEIKKLKASLLADAFVVSFSPGKTIFCGEGACILTNNTDLYKQLVTITQHPYRIKRDVGLTASSEFSLNGRINPFAAIIGDTMFDDCLQSLKEKQSKFLKLYETIDGFHSVMPFRFTEREQLPTFFHLPILVNDIQHLEREINSLDIRLSFQKTSFELLPEQLKRIKKAKSIKTANISYTISLMKRIFLLQSNI